MSLEEITAEDLFDWFEDSSECPFCEDGEYKYLERVDLVKDGMGRPYYNITYECGHRRLVPLVVPHFYSE